MKLKLLRWTSDQLRRKVPVAATAWTICYFWRASNVLGPIWPQSIIFREVNSQYYWGRVKSHLPIEKTRKLKIVTFPLVLDTFTSPFTIPRSNWKANRRADRRSHAVAAGNGLCPYYSGGKWSHFRKRITFLKSASICRGGEFQDSAERSK